MGHAGKHNGAARSLHRTAKTHAQQGRGLKRHAAATQLFRQRGQRALLMRERIAVQVDIGKQHRIVAVGTQRCRIGKRHKTHLGARYAVDLVGLVIVSGTALIHLGADAVEHGYGRGLRHIERAGVVHKNVDGMAQQGRLGLATGLTVETAKRAIGQRLGNREHSLECRHGLVTP